MSRQLGFVLCSVLVTLPASTLAQAQPHSASLQQPAPPSAPAAASPQPSAAASPEAHQPGVEKSSDASSRAGATRPPAAPQTPVVSLHPAPASAAPAAVSPPSAGAAPAPTTQMPAASVQASTAGQAQGTAAPSSAAATVLPSSASAGTTATEAVGSAADEGEGDKGGAQVDPRAQNSWHGSSGGVYIIDGRSGPVGTLQLQLGFDYFRGRDFLLAGDTDEAVSGLLSLRATPIEHLELFASLSSRSNSNNLGNPVLLQVAGDVLLGAKGFKQLLPWLSVGADARLLFLNTVGDLGVTFAGTSVGLRGLATADLRHLQKALPLIVRANLGYFLDNSSAVTDDIERARYDSLPAATRRTFDNEDRNLLTRIERFGLGINRVDMLNIGIGVEGELRPATDFYVDPLLEWQLGIPVNRQGYSCLSVETDASAGAPDGCLAITGLSAAPSTLTLGARVLPPVRGLSALLAFDIGLLGSSTFVRELAPNRPWALLLALGYAIDTRPPKPVVRYYKVPVEVAKPAPVARKRRIHGVVVERGFATPIAGVTVHYADKDLTSQLTAADGSFTSYELDPGEVVLELSHPDYEPGRCVVRIPEPEQAARSRPRALAGLTTSAAPETAPASAHAPPPPVEARCELQARPRKGGVHGSVSNAKGAPVAGVMVEITGPAGRNIVTDADGTFSAAELPAGNYVAHVDSPKHLLKTQQFSVEPGGDTSLLIELVSRPKHPQVQLTKHEVQIRTQIRFKVNSADIDERSAPLLSEIADTLQRNPQVEHVEVQGHTDNRGDSADNLRLSQARAEAVVRWLVNAGVDASRLDAKGYGDTRPLVPNLTPGNRARNRRVQFIIKSQ